jgi:hypothetical protein
MKRYSKLFILLGIVILIFSACSPIKGEENKHIITPTMGIPTPNATTGVVYGKITSDKTGSSPEASLFLSKNITADQPDLPAMLSFSYQTSPRAQIDEFGNFYFANVPEGIYAITLWTPPNDTFFVPDEDGQDYLWVNVIAGGLIDVGNIIVP